MKPRTLERIDRVLAEMLRRKGLSIADAQRMARGEPWHRRLSWNAAEEGRYRRWWKSYMRRETSLARQELDESWLWFSRLFGLHDRTRCTSADHRHDEIAEADLPQGRWLPVAKALGRLPLPDEEASRAR